MDIIKIAKECGSYVVDEGVDWTAYMFGEDELQQFAQRIEQPHLQRIAELEHHIKELEENIDIERDEIQSLESEIQGYEYDEAKLNEQIAQLREALQGVLHCPAIHDVYGDDKDEETHEAERIARKALEQTK